jgi:hypothetical protein
MHLQANIPPRVMSLFVASEEINLIHAANINIINKGFGGSTQLLFEWYSLVTRCFEIEDIMALPFVATFQY